MLESPGYQPLSREEAQTRAEKAGGLELFSGSGVISLELLRRGCPWVEIWDRAYDSEADLLIIPNQRLLLARILAGMYEIVYLCPPGATFSRARIPGVRSAKFPLGNPWVHRAADRQKLQEENDVLSFCLEVVRCCLMAGIWFV